MLLQDNGSGKYFQGSRHTPNMGEKVAQVNSSSLLFSFTQQHTVYDSINVNYAISWTPQLSSGMREQWNVVWNMWKRRPIWMRQCVRYLCAIITFSHGTTRPFASVCLRQLSQLIDCVALRTTAAVENGIQATAKLCITRQSCANEDFCFCFTEEMQWCQNMLQLSSIQFLVHNVLCRVRPNTNDKLFFRFSLAGECCSWVWRHSKHIHCRIILHVEIRLNRSHRNT